MNERWTASSTDFAEPAPRHGHVLGISKRGFHRITYVEWGDSGSPFVVICLHGLTRQGRDFDPLAMRLAGMGYRVICPDLPGRGRSDWLQDPDEYVLPQYCLDMTVLLSRLRAKRVDWIGTSLGGLTGIIAAGLKKTPVHRLVINDIGPYLAWPALFRIGGYLREMPTEFASLEHAEVFIRNVLAPYGELDDAAWLHLTRYSVDRRPDGSCRMLCDPGIARAFRPGLLYDLSLWRYYDAITCPTLLLRGATTSDLLDRVTATRMTQRGPAAKLIEFPDCGHAPPLMDDEQISVVTDWLGPA